MGVVVGCIVLGAAPSLAKAPEHMTHTTMKIPPGHLTAAGQTHGVAICPVC
ncbi:hypothetical protein F9C07_6094 [Aspergillus flavus]|uniref:Uncharacterized protein n=1 Tax=Aspergillus flavus (strain ATCC 200026 / FGSC A1120 / IAM 13836 / NRRL 3357 / JCM 12722 / SRRC 167) TaxID=332952 RepID=A0A7U2MID1_ASPFN|nr:hypothetical protein F9C07_6094 [Aspergillus flavus]